MSRLFLLVMPACERDNFCKVVRLYLYARAVGGPVAPQRSAYGAPMVKNVALFGIRLGGHRLHHTAALAGPVTGQVVQMAAPETKGAVVSRGKAQRLYHGAAVAADKTAVFFLKTLVFHEKNPFIK